MVSPGIELEINGTVHLLVIEADGTVERTEIALETVGALLSRAIEDALSIAVQNAARTKPTGGARKNKKSATRNAKRSKR